MIAGFNRGGKATMTLRLITNPTEYQEVGDIT